MLLKRLATHFRKQRWTDLSLEFLIVIVGVFLGIQASNLNDEFKARAEERVALERLKDEAERVVTYWRGEVLLSAKYNEDRLALLKALDAASLEGVDRRVIDDAFMRLAHYPQFNPPRSVYEELVAAGGLSKISDVEVRAAVAGYAAELDFALGQLSFFRDATLLIVATYRGRVISAYAPDHPSGRRFVYDFPALAEDRLFVSDIVDLVRDQLQFHTIREEVLRHALAMCESVSAAIDTSCEPPPVSEQALRARDGVNLPAGSAP